MIDKLEWTPSPPPLARALAARALFDQDDPAALGSVEVTGRMANLPFYRSLDLFHLELKPVAGPAQHLFVLAHGRNLYVLDGTSVPIHDANKSGGIAVTEE